MNQERLISKIEELKGEFFALQFPESKSYIEKISYYCEKAAHLANFNFDSDKLDPNILDYINGDYSLSSLDWFEEESEINGCFAVFILSYMVFLNRQKNISNEELLFCEAVVAGMLYEDNITRSGVLISQM